LLISSFSPLDEDGFQYANADDYATRTGEVQAGGNATATAQVVVDFGNDVPSDLPASFAFIDPTALNGQLFAIGGAPIVFALEGDALVGRANGEPLVEISLHSATLTPGTSQVVYELQFRILGPVQHGEQNEDSVTLDGIAFQIVDGSSDVVSGQTSATIFDDIPVAGVDDTIPLSVLTVDESDGSGSGADGAFVAEKSFAANFGTTIAYGADGAGSVSYALILDGSNVGSGLYAVDPAAPDGKGEPIVLNQNATTGVITGSLGTVDYFTIEVDAAGTVTFTLTGNAPVWHENTGNHDDASTLDVAAGALLLEQTVTDADGDTDTASIDIGAAGIFKIEDDGPVAGIGSAHLTVDEDDILTGLSVGTSPNDGGGDGSFTGDPLSPFDSGPANASGSLSGLVSFGADGPSAGGGFSFAGDAAATLQGLGLTSKGADLTYSEAGGVLTATAGGRTVFTLELSGDGDFTFRLFDQLDHVDGDGENTALFSKTATSGSVPVIDFGSVIQATDGDGDSVTLDGRVNVTVRDDIPATFLTATGATVTHDESAGLQLIGANDTNLAVVRNQFQALETANPGLTALGYAGNLAPQFLFGSPSGADEGGTRSVVLNVAGGGGVDSGLVATGGTPIFLYEEDGLIVGRLANGDGSANAEGDVAFAISLSTVLGTGHIAVAQYLAIEHDPNNGPNDIETLAGKIEVVFTVTDHDGDTVVKTADIGAQIRFRDDAPTAVRGGNVRFEVDEDGLDNAQSKANTDADRDGEIPGTGLATASGAPGALNALVNFGADGPHPTEAFALKVFTATQFGTWKSGGEQIFLISDGATLRGYVDGDGIAGFDATDDRLVFELEVGGDGSYSFTLHDQIDHPSLDGLAGDDSENLLSGNGMDLSGFIVAKDGDGDTVDLAGGSFTVQVRDDIPVVTALPEQTTTVDINYSMQAGNVLYRALQGQDDFDLLLTGKNSTGPLSVNSNGQGAAAGIGTPRLEDGETLRIDLMKGLTATGNNSSGTYNAAERFTVSQFTFTIPQVQGNPSYPASLFIQLFSVAPDDDLTNTGVDFSDAGPVDITSILINGASIALPVTLTPSGSGYILSGVKEGDVITVTGDGPFGRIEIGNHGGDGFHDFNVGGFGAAVEVALPFEIRHDETSGVNDGADPNPADDTADPLPAALDAAIAGLAPIGHAVSAGSLSGLFTYQVGADEPASVGYALTTASGGTFNGVDSGLKTTEGGHQINLYSDGDILWGIANGDLASGTRVFAAHVDASGKLWLVQFEAIAHDVDGSDANAFDDAISVTADIRVSLSVTDNDGDTTTAASSTKIKLTFQDDGPSVENATGEANEGGAVIEGQIVFDAGQDGGGVTHIDGTLLVFVGGWSQWIPGANGQIRVQSDGAYEFQPQPDDVYNSGGTTTFSFTVTDGDGDTAEGTVAIEVADDTDTTTIALDSPTVDEGGTVTVTATVDNAPKVTPLVITLS
ncbi:DUF5801 repeats-in-toxin domain-containing protein, partial [Mycolicibacterium sp.]|uniref:DUF5801 repeats-in-toxin domain-containing protein n=1 Tax=Mycolicibacterium sp. TaxID=2320850 RepID=UPI00355D4116